MSIFDSVFASFVSLIEANIFNALLNLLWVDDGQVFLEVLHQDA